MLDKEVPYWSEQAVAMSEKCQVETKWCYAPIRSEPHNFYWYNVVDLVYLSSESEYYQAILTKSQYENSTAWESLCKAKYEEAVICDNALESSTRDCLRYQVGVDQFFHSHIYFLIWIRY